MTAPKNSIYGFIALLVFVGVLLAWWAMSEERPAVLPSTAPIPTISSSTLEQNKASLESATALSSAALLEPGKVSSDLVKRWNAGGNVREFVEYALKHPLEGGNFYAERALRRCAQVSPDLLAMNQTQFSGQPDYQKISSSADSIRSACKDLTASELSEQRRKDILTQGLNSKDPLVSAMHNYVLATSNYKPESRAQRLSATAIILDLADPLLIDDVGSRLTIAFDPQTNRVSNYFQGKYYPLDGRDGEVGLALFLLPCAMGSPCDSSDHEVRRKCAVEQQCAASRAEIVRGMLGAKPDVYAATMAIYERMALAVSRKSVDDFVAK